MHTGNKQPIVTIAGGSGFLGRYAVKLLAQEGYTLRVLCRDPESAKHLKTLGQVGQIVIEAADFSRPNTLRGKLDGSWAVINLVGIFFEHGKHHFTAIHAQGAEKLAQMAAEAGAEHFVHISALGIQEAGASKYARTKLLGEKAVQAAFPQAALLRPGVLFGPEDSFFNRFAAMACYSPVIPVVGPNTKFQPVYVMDVAEVIRQALVNPALRGKALELGGPNVYTFRELVEFILRSIGRSPAIVPVPFSLAGIMAAFTEFLPNPPLTRDQVRLLHYDSIVSKSASGFEQLGLSPSPVELIVPGYLSRFRRQSPDLLPEGEN